MPMNNAITIDDRLWFEETSLGGTLNFQTRSELGEPLLFQVGISFQSMLDCAKALSASFSEWKIRDGSLSVYGDREELALHFASPDGGDFRGDHVLRGRELNLFRYAIFAIAQRQVVALN